MLVRGHIGSLLVGAGMVLASFLAAETAYAQAKVFEISSTTFKDGGMLPTKAANSKANAPNNANCVGENVSPQLSWVNPPAGTKSFVLLMTDPEGRGGAGVNHWVSYGIPAEVTGFAEGEVSKESPKYVGGKSTQGVGFYSGPCTPPNVQPHHYTFVLVATDFEPKELAAGLTKDEVTAKIVPQGAASRAKGSAGIVGLFVKPN
jgi:Raf kinase inhibitor-like YbhB/YbcL family protein